MSQKTSEVTAQGGGRARGEHAASNAGQGAMSLWARAFLAASTFLLLVVPGAHAHGGDANYRSVIERVTPSVPGLEVEIRNYDAEMELVAPDGNEVTIFGYEDEPYARILADGTVQVNERSPATYLNEDRYGESAVPEFADPQTLSRWRTVDKSGRFVWHDHRMHYMAEGTAPQVTDESVKTKVFDYRLPIEIDGRRGAIAGTLYWVGPEDTSKLPFILAGAVLLLGGGGLVLFVRRRRERSEGRQEEAW